MWTTALRSPTVKLAVRLAAPRQSTWAMRARSHQTTTWSGHSVTLFTSTSAAWASWLWSTPSRWAPAPISSSVLWLIQKLFINNPECHMMEGSDWSQIWTIAMEDMFCTVMPCRVFVVSWENLFWSLKNPSLNFKNVKESTIREVLWYKRVTWMLKFLSVMCNLSEKHLLVL